MISIVTSPVSGESETGFSLDLATANPADFVYSSLFDGGPSLRVGSSFAVQEELKIFVNVYEPQLISIDFSSFVPKRRLGSLQVLTADALDVTQLGETFPLESLVQSISRRSIHTVVCNFEAPGQIGDSFSVSDCNFSVGISTIGIVGAQTGIGNLITQQDALRGQSVYYPSQLIDRPFFPLLGKVGIKTQIGCEVVSLQYKATSINFVRTADFVAPILQCSGQTSACDNEFDAYLATIPSPTYKTFASADAACPGQVQGPYTFVGTVDPAGCVREYYDCLLI